MLYINIQINNKMNEAYWIHKYSFIFKYGFNNPIDNHIDIVKNYEKIEKVNIL